MMPTTKLGWALWAAAKGIRVFRGHPNAKTPIDARWYEAATTDTATITKWWSGQGADNNVLWLMGEDGLGAIDLDCKRPEANGENALFDLEMEHAEFVPRSFMQRTPSGGLHILVKTEKPLANTAGKIAPGIDTKGHHGYVVGAGSTIDGKQYELLADGPPAPCPAWVFAAAGASRPKSEKANTVIGEIDTEHAISLARYYLFEEAPEGTCGVDMNNTIYQVAARVKDFGVSEAMALDLILEEWIEDKGAGANLEEVPGIVANAYRHGREPIGIANPANEFEPVEQAEEVSLPLPIQNIGDFGWSNHRDYLVRGLLNRGMIAITSGEANAGKSPVMLDLAVAIMRGQQWNGMRVIKPWYVLHISTEGWTGLKDRMKALGVAHDIKPGEPMDFVATSLDLRNSAKSARDIIKTVKARAAHFGLEAGLVVVDTLSHAMGGGDDSNQEHMKAVLINCRRIATETGAAVMLIHHPTKDGASKIRGTGITKDDTDLHIWVEADKATESRTLSTPRTKEYAQIRPIKFNIKVVPLGEDQYGDPITSVVVEWAGSAASEFPVVLTGQSQELWSRATRHVLRTSPEDVQSARMSCGKWAHVVGLPEDTLYDCFPKLVEAGVAACESTQKGKLNYHKYYLTKLDPTCDDV